MDLSSSSPAADGGSDHHEDDELGSTVAVHAASPRPGPGGFSSRSARDDTTDDDYPASDDEDITSLDPTGALHRKRTSPGTTNDPDDRNEDDDDDTDKSPAQLSLNKMNLKTFETSVKRGNIPLRSDMLGSRQALPAKNVTASSSMFVNSGMEDASPVRSVTHPQSPLSRRENSHSLAPLDKISVASIDCEVGSLLPQREGDDLNVENLREHMRELYSGQPLPLHSENIGSNRPQRRSPRSERRDDFSVMVEPSEADAPSITSSAVLPLDTNQRRAQEESHSSPRGTDTHIANVEDLWSTASTGDHDHSLSFRSSLGPMSVGGDGVMSYSNMLSTESLVQLRRQLESGETPLRPEMLYGFIRAMGQSNPPPTVSPSMVVEVPNEDRGGFGSPAGPRHGAGVATATNKHRHSEALGTDGDMDAAEVGSTSPHVNDMDPVDGVDDDDVDDLEDDPTDLGSRSRRHRRHGADDNSSVPDHNESMILTDADNYTEETEMGMSKDQIRELWRAIVELKNERRQLERRFAETSHKLDTMDARSQQLMNATQVAISHKLDVAVQAIESRLSMQLQDAVRALQGVVAAGALRTDASVTGASPLPASSTGDGAAATTPPSQPRIRLLMQVAPSLLRDAGATPTTEQGAPLEFIVPMEAAATVGEAKAKFMSRLQQVGVLKTTASLSTCVLRYKGHNVFDEDSLADIVDASCLSPGEQQHAHVFVLDEAPSK